ncbi:MAG: family glycosyltransferase [Gemmataceae bacterium]|nr:family glycosyltransferase [Gemmataceae bacterium]
MGDRLNVTHIVLSLDVGGLERNVVNQVREGERLGQRVSILCVERPGALAPRARELGAHLVSLDKRPGFRPALARQMRAVLRELRPDVIHTHQIGPLLYTGLATLVRRPLLVHTEHGKEDYAGHQTRRWLGRIAGRFVRRFYCLSQDTADWVARFNIVPRSRVRLIRNGIDLDCYRRPGDTAGVRRSLGIPPDAPVIGTVGRLDEIKQQDLLLRAFANLRAPAPPPHLLLVGDGPLRGPLRRTAEDLGIGDRVHFAGYQAETTPYLHTMQLFALTSRSEGMPQSLLEACVAGIPVVAARVGGIPEVIEHGHSGLLFPSGDEAALVAALEALLASPDSGRRLAGRAQARVESAFHIGRMAGEYHRDFLQLLGRNQTPGA